jgi:MFS family permease
MTALASQPGALRLFVISILARLPLAMLAIGVLVHVKAVTGSFAAAGLASGTLAVAQGIGGPLLGRLVDRRGQTTVLVAGALVAGCALVALAAAPAGAPLAMLLVLAAALGGLTPPVPACIRALLPGLVDEPEALRRAYAADSAAVELTWISGPPLVLLIGALTSTGAALAVTGAMLVLLTLLFAAAPASRRWQAPERGTHAVRGALHGPGIRTLALVLAGTGLVFGGTEVAVTAAAEDLGRTAAAGPLLGLWGLGGLLGGLAATHAGGGARSGAGLALLVAALGCGHAALAATASSFVALALAIVLAGTFIAPTCATAYAMVDEAAPHGTVTEAFAWMATAVAIGTSLGAAVAGAVADAAGPAPTFLLAGAPAVLVAPLAASRAHTLTTDPNHGKPTPAARPVTA